MKSNLVWIFALSLIASLSSQASYAQGSPYNLIGFGLPVRSANPVLEAMGGVGAALEGSRTINDLNPADWTWLSRARFDIAGRFDYTSSDFGTSQDQQHSIHIDGIQFGAPFWSEMQGGLALGYVALTHASSEIVSVDPIGTTTSISTGGANMLFLGMGFRPWNWLVLGGRVDLIVGNIRHQDHVVFNDVESDSAEFERDYPFSGVRPTFGVELIGDSISDGLSGLAVGASYSFPAKLTSTREDIITPISSALDTTIDVGGVGRYPSTLLTGISYQFSRRYRAEIDYSMQGFAASYVYSPVEITGDKELRNSSRFAVGVERLANVAGEFGTSFGLDKWALRLGFSYSQLPISPGVSTGVREIALSGGIGIPIGYESLLNLMIVGGQRAPLVSGGQAPKETFLRLGGSISMSERWFVPTRRD